MHGNDQKNVTKHNQATKITWATRDFAQQQQEQICCLCFVLLMLNFVGQETGRDRTVSFVCLKPNNIENYFLLEPRIESLVNLGVYHLNQENHKQSDQ